MLRHARFPAALVVAGALVAAVACSDRRAPTSSLAAPDDASALQGGNTRVKIKTLQLSANTLRIEGPAVTAAMSIGNSGLAFQANVSYRADIVQGATTRQAAKGPTQCNPGDSPGFLPAGNCDMTVPVAVSNAALGSGTLVPGAAVLVMRILETTVDGQNELANKSVAVNLVATPSITSLTLSPTTIAIGGPSASWTATLQNPANSLQNVSLQAYMVQGATRQPAGGVAVSCGSAIGVLAPGTCTVSFTTSAANGVGTGTLVPGPATFELNLNQSNGGTTTTFDTKTVAVTLVSSTPSIASLVLTSTSIVIGGQTDYTAQIQNYGFPQTDIFIQGEMSQQTESGTVVKGAGGTVLTCSSPAGALPTGTCSQQFTAAASSDATGGSLVPGPASFVLHLYKSNGIDVAPTELDVKTVEVTLVSPIPTITSIVPTSSYVVLGSGYTSYTTTIQNPGPPRSTVLVQGWISQGTARRAAGGSNVNCAGSPNGTLPTGTCSTLADIVASNDPIIVGTGTLVPGPATFELELKQYDGTTTTILDTESIPITLVASTPSIVSIDFTSTTIAIGGQSRYTATLYNPTSSTLTGTLIQGTITQGANSAPAGGVATSCPSSFQVAPGSCAVTFTANPSNANSSPGPLVPGAATFVLQFYQNGSVLDTKSVAITLTSP